LLVVTNVTIVALVVTPIIVYSKHVSIYEIIITLTNVLNYIILVKL